MRKTLVRSLLFCLTFGLTPFPVRGDDAEGKAVHEQCYIQSVSSNASSRGADQSLDQSLPRKLRAS